MLRKSPTRTEAFLAANRRNALKSTGPRTARGKARSCMNALKHGRYAKRLPESLTAAGDRGGAALYQKVRGEIGATFPAATAPAQTRQLDQFTAKVWVLARAAGVNGRKPRLGKFSMRSGPLPTRRLLFRMVDEHRRIGIVYWVQRKRYWTLARKLEALAGIYPANVPTLGEALQDKLRHRVYRMRRPGLWEQQRLWGGARLNRVPPVGPDGVRTPPSGVQPSQTGPAGENGDATRMAVSPGSVQSGHDNATPKPQRRIAGVGPAQVRWAGVHFGELPGQALWRCVMGKRDAGNGGERCRWWAVTLQAIPSRVLRWRGDGVNMARCC